jgi:antirestriction protein
MLSSSPDPFAEEFAIHDYEGFGPVRLGEFERLEDVARLAEAIVDIGMAYAHWASYVGSLKSEDLDGFAEAYQGQWTSFEEYAENLLDDMGIRSTIEAAIPVGMQPYVSVDVEAFARDLEMDHYVADSDDGSVYIYWTL